MDYEVQGVIPRGRQKKTWTEVVEKYCRTRQQNTKDALDRSK